MSKNATKLKKKLAREKQVQKENNEQRNAGNKNEHKAERKAVTVFNKMNRGQRRQAMRKVDSGGLLGKIKSLFVKENNV